MAYSKQTWDTTSFVNPTRMNHIEDGIYEASGGETKYIRGTFAITATNNKKNIILATVNELSTDNKDTKFDIIINSSGKHSFQGYLYPDKTYGAGMYFDFAGSYVTLWRRQNGTDYFYDWERTEI